MSIIIGDKLGSDFSDPIGLLTDCHRRVEKFLDVLHKVAGQGRDGRLIDEHRPALEVALKYFLESAPKHTADEEESLFPRMLTRAGPQLDLIAGVLETLNADHRTLTESHERIDDLGRCWLADDFLRPLKMARLLTEIQNLKDCYPRHIALEEDNVFRFARQILLAEDLDLIAKEMAGRRGLPVGGAMAQAIPRILRD